MSIGFLIPLCLATTCGVFLRPTWMIPAAISRLGLDVSRAKEIVATVEAATSYSNIIRLASLNSTYAALKVVESLSGASAKGSRAPTWNTETGSLLAVLIVTYTIVVAAIALWANRQGSQGTFVEYRTREQLNSPRKQFLRGKTKVVIASLSLNILPIAGAWAATEILQ